MLLEGGEYSEEYRVQHPNGQVRWICATGHCQPDGIGRLVRLMGAGGSHFLTGLMNIRDFLVPCVPAGIKVTANLDTNVDMYLIAPTFIWNPGFKVTMLIYEKKS